MTPQNFRLENFGESEKFCDSTIMQGSYDAFHPFKPMLAHSGPFEVHFFVVVLDEVADDAQFFVCESALLLNYRISVAFHK